MSTMYEYFNAGDDSSSGGIYGTHWASQVITIGSDGPDARFTLTKIRVFISQTGTVPGNVNMSIRYNLVAPDISTGSIPANSIIASAWYDFNMTPCNIEPDALYRICLSAPLGDAGNYIFWRYKAVGTYGGGDYETSVNSGGSWATSVGADTMFETYGDPVATIMLTGNMIW